MALASLQVCMDSSDWFQGSINDENGGVESSSQSGDILTCSRPIIERKLRPQQDLALKCPRCDSTHTKFCYYNNYSLTQPRYFCKTCRRYWTKGGTLRNIPVGGGCRKNKKISKKGSNEHHHHNHQLTNQNSLGSSSSHHIPFPDHVFNSLVENPNPRGFDFMVGNSKGYDFGGNGDMGILGFGEMNNGLASNYGFCSPFGISIDGSGGNLLMVPYEGNGEYNSIEMKPSTKFMSLDWQDQGGKDSCVDTNINNLGSWNGIMNGYGSSTTNPLV